MGELPDQSANVIPFLMTELLDELIFFQSAQAQNTRFKGGGRDYVHIIVGNVERKLIQHVDCVRRDH